MSTVLAVLDAVVNSLWQAVAVTALVWLALKFLRRTNAATRHSIWLATVAVVLLLPAVPRLIVIMRPLPHPTAVKVSTVFPKPEAHPVTIDPVILTVAPDRTARWPFAILAAWAAILLWRLIQIGRSYIFLRGVRRRAAVSPMPLPVSSRRVNLLISREVVSPMAVGFLPGAIILPESMREEISEPEYEHVLLHEAAHLARYDDWSNLAMRLIGGVLALHPVAVWILRQIEREREMACDDWVVARTGGAKAYASSLARIFELRWKRRDEALASGIFGLGSSFRNRIEMLLRRDRTFSPRASVSGIAAGTAALACLTLAGSLAPRWIAFAQEHPRPAFDVASVKLNVDGGRGGSFTPMSGGRLTVKNNPLSNVIGNAYGVFQVQIVGGPGWINSERFDIEARAEDSPDEPELMLMLRRFLEDRFKLKVHRETRELPVFALIAARGGIKLKPSKEGSCVAINRFNPSPTAPQGQEPQKHCGDNRISTKELETEWNATKIDMTEVTIALSSILRRPVVDKTGFTGTFDLHLAWPRDPLKASPLGPESGKASANAADPSLFTLLQEQLGLKLKSAKDPVDVLVIDHVEKPDAN